MPNAHNFDDNGSSSQGSAGQQQALSSALRTLDFEIKGLNALKGALIGPMGKSFFEAVETLCNIKGRVVISGMGKSGHIGQKIAATLASTGTPAFFVHPGEASHGDLGMITPQDAIIALSWSGETAELTSLLNYSRRFSVPLIAFTSKKSSTLARTADIPLVLPRAEEACPHGLAPTTSSLMQLALGDALAVALLEARGFSATDFKVFHPGGQLGAQLMFVSDIMHKAEKLPLVEKSALMSHVIVEISEKSFGCAGVVDPSGHLLGIITDGDLRRNIANDLMSRTAEEIMTAKPQTVGPDTMVSKTLEIMNTASITAIFVVEGRRPIGLVHMHDLLRHGVA